MFWLLMYFISLLSKEANNLYPNSTVWVYWLFCNFNSIESYHFKMVFFPSNLTGLKPNIRLLQISFFPFTLSLLVSSFRLNQYYKGFVC